MINLHLSVSMIFILYVWSLQLNWNIFICFVWLYLDQEHEVETGPYWMWITKQYLEYCIKKWVYDLVHNKPQILN